MNLPTAKFQIPAALVDKHPYSPEDLNTICLVIDECYEKVHMGYCQMRKILLLRGATTVVDEPVWIFMVVSHVIDNIKKPRLPDDFQTALDIELTAQMSNAATCKI